MPGHLSLHFKFLISDSVAIATLCLSYSAICASLMIMSMLLKLIDCYDLMNLHMLQKVVAITCVQCVLKVRFRKILSCSIIANTVS